MVTQVKHVVTALIKAYDTTIDDRNKVEYVMSNEREDKAILTGKGKINGINDDMSFGIDATVTIISNMVDESKSKLSPLIQE